MKTWRAASVLAGAVGGASVGYHHDDGDPVDRTVAGGLFGAALGYGAFSVGRRLALSSAVRQSVKSSHKNVWNWAKNYAKTNAEAYSKFVAAGDSKVAAFHKTFGNKTLYTLAGAGIGAAMDPDGDHVRGALIGAGAGYLARSAYSLGRFYNGPERGVTSYLKAHGISDKYAELGGALVGTPWKLGLVAAGSAAAGMAGTMSPHPEVEMEANTTETGSSPIPAGSGVRERMSLIGADGSIVFGLHNKRR